MDKPQFTANDAQKYMSGLSTEQSTQWARLANLTYNNYVKRYKNTSPLVLRERVISEVSAEMIRQWNSR